MERVVVFVDAQNFYRSAKRAFFEPEEPVRNGQFHPRALGEHLASRDSGRTLEEVRVYTGRPGGFLQPRAHAANLRQCQAWERDGCYVFSRPLRYPHRWPHNAGGQRPEEKGIDVAIALDMVRLAMSGSYDIAILCSADTDLVPAVEAVLDGGGGHRVEVAGWRAEHYRQRLSLKGRRLWCHWLRRADFDAVRDDTDYNLGAHI